MTEAIGVSKDLSKEEKYQELYPQIGALLKGEDDLIASLSNLIAILKNSFVE